MQAKFYLPQNQIKATFTVQKVVPVSDFASSSQLEEEIERAKLSEEKLSERIKAIYNSYTYEQGQSSSTWQINHNLNKYPSVTVVDSAGDEILCDIKYINKNSCVLNFTAPFKGTAYLN